ncbi:MAG: Zn-ribbon domain-containing OB-fold protein [Chloroflexota bacterium]
MAKKTKEEILVGERNFDSIFNYDAGAVRSRFLTEIRDNRKLTGIRCPQCNLVYVPPRSVCLKCFANLSDFVEVGQTGTLTTYSIVYRSEPFCPVEAPFVYGIVRLDGADTGLVHFISEVDLQKVHTGMRVKAVYKEERVGSILDIKYFKPAGGEK